MKLTRDEHDKKYRSGRVKMGRDIQLWIEGPNGERIHISFFNGETRVVSFGRVTLTAKAETVRVESLAN